MFKEKINWNFAVSLVIMILGTIMIVYDIMTCKHVIIKIHLKICA